MKFSQTLFLATVTTVCLILTWVTPVRAQAKGIGGPYGDYAMAYPGTETLTLFVVPDGSGETFDRAFLPYGGRADATITLWLRDANNDPVPNFPREDMWLVSEDGGLFLCPAGSIADANTDGQGTAFWTQPLRSGGHSEGRTEVRVNGSPVELSSGVRLGFNSPDINGDLTVNLTDVQIFTTDFYGPFDFRSDFYRDGSVNLSDLAEMAHAFGAGCP